MTQPSNHDLHIMLTEIRGDIKAVLLEQSGSKAWQESHEKSDKKNFDDLTKQMNGMNKYAASIAIVAGFIGACSSYLWKKISGV